MKAISLWQPWASLIACGAKPYETRSWAPPSAIIGTTIAIHAAKRVDKIAAGMATDIMYGQYDHHGGLAESLEASWGSDEIADGVLARFGEIYMPVGCVVCTARLDAAFQLGERAEGTAVEARKVVRRLISRQMPDCFTVRLDDFGDYSPGRWAWLFRDVKPLKPPPPAIGRQGFFDLPQGWLTEPIGGVYG
jgi:activating signal cointegrator 1